MSKEKPAAPAEGAAPKKSKKLLIIILAAVVLLAAAGGGAYFFLMKGDDNADDEDAAEVEKPKKKKDKKDAHAAPTFVNLEPFTVNLIPENGDQYLQVALVLEVEDPTNEQEIKAHMPKVRNDLMLLLSSKKASELASKEGKEHLAEEVRSDINSLINPPRKGKPAPDGPVKEVLFTSFIIQ